MQQDKPNFNSRSSHQGTQSIAILIALKAAGYTRNTFSKFNFAPAYNSDKSNFTITFDNGMGDQILVSSAVKANGSLELSTLEIFSKGKKVDLNAMKSFNNIKDFKELSIIERAKSLSKNPHDFTPRTLVRDFLVTGYKDHRIKVERDELVEEVTAPLNKQILELKQKYLELEETHKALEARYSNSVTDYFEMQDHLVQAQRRVEELETKLQYNQ